MADAPLDAPMAPPLFEEPPPPKIELFSDSTASLSILIQLNLLGLSMIIGYLLRKYNFRIFHEAGAAMFLGILIGLVATTAGASAEFLEFLEFDEYFFFLFLLPPIIFESGYSMQPVPFFKNFGAICLLAFYGTFISAIVTGAMMFGFGKLGICTDMPMMETLLFGALISATDPVTVLAMFQRMGVDANLYNLVFGESVLNDAVAIVLYKSFQKYLFEGFSAFSLVHGLLNFVFIFVGSFSVGFFIAWFAEMFLKNCQMSRPDNRYLESAFVAIVPYCAYMLAEGLHMSGIVAILFCGIVMKQYSYPLLSSLGKKFTSMMFKVLATLAETFVFIYMGGALFLQDQAWRAVPWALLALFSVLIARCINVFPACWVVNRFRAPDQRIPLKFQKAVWFSGLRGAIAFSLGVQASKQLPDGHGKIMLTSTMYIIFFTVLITGGALPAALDRLEIYPVEGGAGHGHDEDGDDSTHHGHRSKEPRTSQDGDAAIHEHSPVAERRELSVHPEREPGGSGSGRKYAVVNGEGGLKKIEAVGGDYPTATNIPVETSYPSSATAYVAAEVDRMEEIPIYETSQEDEHFLQSNFRPSDAPESPHEETHVEMTTLAAAAGAGASMGVPQPHGHWEPPRPPPTRSARPAPLPATSGSPRTVHKPIPPLLVPAPPAPRDADEPRPATEV
eukprot:jgi/Mesvir1/8721/Mv02650-RA.1